jgi:hypothetical protein
VSSPNYYVPPWQWSLKYSAGKRFWSNNLNYTFTGRWSKSILMLWNHLLQCYLRKFGHSTTEKLATQTNINGLRNSRVNLNVVTTVNASAGNTKSR